MDKCRFSQWGWYGKHENPKARFKLGKPLQEQMCVLGRQPFECDGIEGKKGCPLWE